MSEKSVEINVTSEDIYKMIQRVAEVDGDRAVFEFRKDEDGNVDKILDVTEHLEELESQHGP